MIFLSEKNIEPVTITEPSSVMFGFSMGNPLGPIFGHQIWYCLNCGTVRAINQLKRANILMDTGVEPEGEDGAYSTKQLRGIPGKDLLPNGWGISPIKEKHEDEEVHAYALICDKCTELGNIDL